MSDPAHSADAHAEPESPVPPRPLTDFAAAIGFLTLLPIGREWPDGRRPRSVGWYPWVGLVIGGAGVLVTALVVLVSGEAGLRTAMLVAPRAFVLATLLVAGGAFVTRFLHWDGLGDTFDGIWGGHTPERRLEIMRDSRIGSFGAAAMLMIAMLQVAGLTAALSSGRLWPLLAAPVLGRFAAAAAAWSMPAARREGLGLTVMERPGAYDVGVAAAAVGIVLAVVLRTDPLPGLVAVGLTLAVAFLVPRLLARPVGGMTGDLMGATVLVVETFVLVIGALI